MSGDHRPNPDTLLSSLQREEAAQKRGRLKVFLGMCPGVGKTYAMLEAAQRELKSGRDIAIGYVETHGRVETDALAAGLPVIPRKPVEHRGVALTEMDLDAVLARRPQLALVDELAHTNAPGSRHPKRWQDVKELLDAGIDVFTTVNVQHIESRADTVRQVTGTEIRETVPDSVLDAAELELIDLPTAELLKRLSEGKVYLPERAAAAAKSFFREANLTALRELALRLVADHVGEETTEFHRTQTAAGPWKTGSRLLVAVSSSPLSESLIRWTRRTADSLRCPWVAVYVESSHPLTDEAQARLEKNLALARTLGAEVVTTADEDLVNGLLRIAHQHNVTQIIVGKPDVGGVLSWLRAGQLLRRLTRESGDIDLHIVRAEHRESGRTSSRPPWRPKSGWKQYAVAVGGVGAVGLLNLLLNQIGPRVPGLVFLLAVVLLGLFLGRGPVFVAGALSALAWNFFFLHPRFTFAISNPEDFVLFGLYFVVAIVLGQLVTRIRSQEQAERHREERATALYQLTRELAQVGTRDEAVWQLISEVNRVFRSPAAVALPAGSTLAAHPDSSLTLPEKEINVATWAFQHRQAAGRFTDNLPGSELLHLPLMTERAVLGVLSVNIAERTLTLAQRDLLEAFAQQAALVLDRVALRAAAEQSKLVAESERLSKALLNSISHELRTPIAAITSAASGLRESGALTSAQTNLTVEIESASARLNRLVQSLLSAARIQSGQVKPKLDWCDVSDLVQVTLREMGNLLAGHPVETRMAPKLPLAKLDFVLMEQALANLLVNAAIHTPPGTPVEVGARVEGKELILQVADRGPGLPSGELEQVFNLFHRAPDAKPGGTGLGLAIVRGFVEAQGGRVEAANRPSGGAIFTIRLPLSDAPSLPEETA